jgi:hypothetical protein
MKCPICSEILTFLQFKSSDKTVFHYLDCPPHFYSVWQDNTIFNYNIRYQNETGHYHLRVKMFESSLPFGPSTNLTFQSSPESIAQTILSSNCIVPILQEARLINPIPRLLCLKAFL